MPLKRSRRSRPLAHARAVAPIGMPLKDRRLAAERTARARRRALWVLGGVLVALAGLAAWRSPAMAVRRVRVTGLARLTPEEAQSTLSAAAVPPRTGWARAPIDEMEARLRRLPWVSRAYVCRGLPTQLVVRVIPRTPVATLTVGPDRWELDSNGVLIRRVSVPTASPEIVSPGGFDLQAGSRVTDDAVLATLQVVVPEQSVRPLPVAKIEVDPHGELCLNMTDTVAIRLGQADDLSAKLAVARSIYSEEPRIAEKVAVIDLRCPDAPACLPRAATKPSPREAAQPTHVRSTTTAKARLHASRRPDERSRDRPVP